MKIVLGFILLALFAAPSKANPAQEEFTDGNYLLRSCAVAVRLIDNPDQHETAEDAWRYGLCTGLVTGIMYASSTVCVAPGVTTGQGIRVVDKYLREHPERLNVANVRLIDDALSQAFPCKH
jgi:hypothetical protein